MKDAMNKLLLEIDKVSKHSPIVKPKPILPMSPKKILAGCQLNIKKLKELAKIITLRILFNTKMVIEELISNSKNYND